MTPNSNRRTILRAVAGGVGALCLRRAVVSGQPAVSPAPETTRALEVTRLGDALFVVRGAGCNVVVDANAADAAVVVDGGRKEHSAKLLALLREELSVARIGTLFNSCWHPDRTGLNEALGAAGAKIIAHENTRLWLGRDITTPWDNRTTPRLPLEARPNATFYDVGAVEVGRRQIHYGYLLQAHTDGDLYVHFPDDKLLVTGAAISASTWPLLDWWTGGWIGGLVDAFDVLLGLADDATRVVPGDGALLTRVDLVEQREMYVAIFDRLAKMFFAGMEPADVLAAQPTREFDGRFGSSELFVKLAFRGFGLHFGPDA
jgi:glyoxylase-like metal-dependent hydrolase (beta-lactamase superfamily II)